MRKLSFIAFALLAAAASPARAGDQKTTTGLQQARPSEPTTTGLQRQTKEPTTTNLSGQTSDRPTTTNLQKFPTSSPAK